MIRGPFMRWLGGKWRLSEQICSHMPPRIERYHEPMLGSGSVLLRLVEQGRVGTVRLRDSNEWLIKAWQGLLTDASAVKNELRNHADQHSNAYFLRTRALYKEMLSAPLHVAAAWFLYLNRSSFNGLWRVAKDGSVNLSWGAKSSAYIRNFDKLDAAVAALLGAGIGAGDLVCQDVHASLDQAGDGDVVYVDPPYVSTFVGYTADGWDAEPMPLLGDPGRHGKLARHCLWAARRGAVVLLSQSLESTPIYCCVFEEGQWRDLQIVRLQARRSVSQDASTRGVVTELLYVLGGSNA